MINLIPPCECIFTCDTIITPDEKEIFKGNFNAVISQIVNTTAENVVKEVAARIVKVTEEPCHYASGLTQTRVACKVVVIDTEIFSTMVEKAYYQGLRDGQDMERKNAKRT